MKQFVGGGRRSSLNTAYEVAMHSSHHSRVNKPVDDDNKVNR